MKVTAVEISKEEILDIRVRAPSACAYWARFTGNIAHHEDGSSKLDSEAMKRGICLAMTHSSYVAKQVADHDDLGFIDILAVDVIVQYGLFGKLVYG